MAELETVQERALTEVQVAARLGASVSTLRQWRRRRIGPSFFRIGRAIRYRPEDVETYIQAVRIECLTTQTALGYPSVHGKHIDGCEHDS
jgi:predicted DNA-binding transcriptional regulator AlpA